MPTEGTILPGHSAMCTVVFCGASSPSFFDVTLICEVRLLSAKDAWLESTVGLNCSLEHRGLKYATQFSVSRLCQASIPFSFKVLKKRIMTWFNCERPRVLGYIVNLNYIVANRVKVKLSFYDR